MSFSVVVVSGGKGNRFGEKKQFCLLGGMPLFFHSYLAFQNLNLDEIIFVIDKKDQSIYQTHFKKLSHTYPTILPYTFVNGGCERFLSVWNGLKQCQYNDYVFIHDAARPMVRKSDLLKLKEVLTDSDPEVGVVLVQSLIDTIKKINAKGQIIENLRRDELIAVSTPQGFKLEKIKQAYKIYLSKEFASIPTDDVEIYMSAGFPVQAVYSQFSNDKITYQQDLDLAKMIYTNNKISIERKKLE